MSYEIKLPVFQGPFELLLFFIERDELDIHDIPIAKLTDRFFDYLQQMKELNVPLASEFLHVAATLMRIKSRKLLPLADPEPIEEEKESLQAHLIAYATYRDLAVELGAKADQRAEHYKATSADIEQLVQVDPPELWLQDANMHTLLQSYAQVTKRYAQQQDVVPHKITVYPYEVSEQKKYLLQLLQKQEQIHVLHLWDANKASGRWWFIFNFIAVLELCQEGAVSLQTGTGFNNFFIQQTKQVA